MNYDRIILELMDRVATLEDEIEILKSNLTEEYKADADTELVSNVTDSVGRDTTKYILDGKKYGKNRLVLAIVKKYMEENPDTSANKLITIFDKSLQGSLGVVRTLEDVKKNCTDYKTRFFVLPNETIKTTTDVCVVCTQWGIGNIGNIVVRAKQLGTEVTVVK
jgi:hypothetical protein